MRRTGCHKIRKFLGLRVGECILTRANRAGGVFILGSKGKIELNNTFDERLHMLETDALPSIRNTLFGDNPNRKFKD